MILRHGTQNKSGQELDLLIFCPVFSEPRNRMLDLCQLLFSNTLSQVPSIVNIHPKGCSFSLIVLHSLLLYTLDKTLGTTLLNIRFTSQENGAIICTEVE